MDHEVINQMMADKAGAVQAVVSEIGSFDEAVGYTVDLARKQAHQTVAAPGLDDAQLSVLGPACQAGGLNLLEGPLIEQANRIHVALTTVDWGIAETGTLVLKSASEDIRLATMLADVHIAVLAESCIVPDSAAIAHHLNEILMDDSPSYTAFITGASRTADIERVLAIGVHGPQELHILIHKGD